MIRTILIRALLVLACFTGSFTIGTLASSPATAAASTTNSTTAMLMPALEAAGQLRPTWTTRTCTAFTTWERHETRANLDALVVDSFHVAPKYLGADVGQLYADVEGGGTGSKYVTDDKQYVYEDCNDDSGL